MPRYRVRLIQSAVVSTYYEIDAETQEEAKELARSGECECSGEQIDSIDHEQYCEAEEIPTPTRE